MTFRQDYPSGPPAHAPGAAKILWRLFSIGILFVAAFSLSGTSIPYTEGIDTSWQASIEYACTHGFQFGKDVMFTFGPLGYLGSEHGQGSFILIRILFALVLSTISVLCFQTTTRGLSRPARGFLFVWFILFASYGVFDRFLFFVMACCSLQLIRDDRKTVNCLVILPFLVLLGMIKFSFLVAAAQTVAICGAVFLVRKRYADAAALVAAFPALVLVIWQLLGQKVEYLLPWLRGSLQFAAGYGEAMSLAPKTAVFIFSLCAILLTLSYFALQALRNGWEAQKTGALALIALYVVLSWKQAFVRADMIHFSRFFMPLPLLFALGVSVCRDSALAASSRRVLAAFSLGVVACCAVAAEGQFHGTNLFRAVASDLPSNLARQGALIANIATGRFGHCFEALAQKPEQPALPNAAQLIGSAPVDVVNQNSWPVIAAGMNYTPRPVFQGYAAFTPYLQQLNLDFMQSTRAPQWVVLDMATIDDRFPLMDDALLYPWLLKNYRPAAADGSYLLLGKNPGTAAAPVFQLVAEETTTFDQPVNLVPWQGSALMIRVELEESLPGKLISLVYPRPVLMWHLGVSGKTVSKRFIPKIARSGVLLNPVLLNNGDVANFYRGSWHHLDRLTISAANHARLFYRDRITIKIYTMS